MLLFWFHQFVKRPVFGTTRLFDVFHQLDKLQENVQNQIFDVLDVFKQSHLNASLDKVVLIIFRLKKAKSVEEDIFKSVFKFLDPQTT